MNKLPIFQKGHHGNMSFDSKARDNSSFSLFIFSFSILVVFMIIAFRLFQLTIVKGEYYRRLSEENRIKELIIEPKRGRILDRKGLTVAGSIEADVKDIKERLASRRIYPEGEAAAHLAGYRQIADKDDIVNSACPTKPRLNDKVGKKGVEKVYECELKGRAGKKLIELDARGKYVKTMSIAQPQDGRNIQLALDLDLQKKAYEALGNRRGAVVGLRPNTGEILLLTSSPSFNPQDFEDNKRASLENYLTDEDKPLFNRATEAEYPPGSIFKMVIATSALQDKKIDEKTIFMDNGEIQAGPLKFGNWYFLQYGKTEGPVDIIKAIRRSNDIFFYLTGDRVGPDRIKYWAEKFGFGIRTSLPFDQSTGLIPSPFWKEEVIKDRWYQGDNYNMAIGQGYLLVNPLQVTVSTAVFANGGKLCQPMLLKDEKPVCKSLRINKKNLGLIREGMRQACSPGGTGWPLFDFGIREEIGTNRIITDEATKSAKFKIKKIPVGCKTGTAENNGKSGLPHAWFTAFAPYDNPELVLTVLVEESGQGSDIAAPIAKEIFKTYFERKE